MKSLISFERSVQLSLIIFGIFILFHQIIIVGIVFLDIVPLDFLWGGKMETKEQLVIFEIVSLLVMLFCFGTVLFRSKRAEPRRLLTASRVALWILSGLFLLNTIGNLLAKTTFENLFAVVTAVLAFLCLRMALEPIDIKAKN